MTEDHEVWFRDPITLLENLLSNPDFKDEFDYTPYQEYKEDGSHCYETSCQEIGLGRRQ